LIYDLQVIENGEQARHFFDQCAQQEDHKCPTCQGTPTVCQYTHCHSDRIKRSHRSD
jgi:hypothetical protein